MNGLTSQKYASNMNEWHTKWQGHGAKGMDTNWEEYMYSFIHHSLTPYQPPDPHLPPPTSYPLHLAG